MARKQPRKYQWHKERINMAKEKVVEMEDRQNETIFVLLDSLK